MLRQACKRYIDHNEAQLSNIDGVRTYRYGTLLKPIYGPWLACIYERIVEGIYDLDFWETHEGSL